LNSNEIRDAFLRFFEEKGHRLISSSSLVPKADPTLLLTTAGMVQFKRYFIGEATPPHPRLASCQKCFRATDIDSVGNYKHLTFFEMLGNFSVGDYFKSEAIQWAWEFVTQGLGLPQHRLWVTIFTDDDEAFDYWREVGFPKERILRFGEEDNFWGPAGETGPCGPCSELHYDHGEDTGCGRAECGPNCVCGRFSEIWNLVFTQYDQQRDGSRIALPKPNIDTGMGLERTAAAMQGVASIYETDLFAPLIDSVARLAGKRYRDDEATDRAMRIVAEHARAITFLIGDGVIPSNEGRGYVLRRVLRRAALFGRKLGLEQQFLGTLAQAVIAQMGSTYPELKRGQENILSTIAAEESRFDQTLNVGLNLLDGIIPLKKEAAQAIDEEKEGWRTVASQASQEADDNKFKVWVGMIIDMLMALGGKLAARATSLDLPSAVALGMQTALMPIYDKLEKLQEDLRDATSASIRDVLDEGIEELQHSIHTISGEETFLLYDTYGFPKDITTEIAADNGFSVDLEGFNAEMERQRERARTVLGKASFRGTGKLQARASVVEATNNPASKEIFGATKVSGSLIPTEFVGFARMRCQSEVINLADEEKSVGTVTQGQRVQIVLNSTPFYGEMGGQAGDNGEIRGKKGRVEVTNTVRHTENGSEFIVHRGKVVEGQISVNDTVEAKVDGKRRLDIARNHTATHLLQAALREVLGEHVRQSGSLVAADHLRFDFTYPGAPSKEQLDKVQRIVNETIRQNLKVKPTIMPYQQGLDRGALAFFEEQYGNEVRVLEIGNPPISIELCGGTHVKATGEIGFFHIVGESSIGAGVRRIEAVTGSGAEGYIERQLLIIDGVAKELKAEPSEINNRISALHAEIENERKRALSLERELVKKTVESLLNEVLSVNGITVLSARVPASNMDALRHTGDLIKQHQKSILVVLGAVYDNQANFVAMLTPDLVKRGLHAGEIVKQVARVAGGRGGGRAETGQAGSKDIDKLDDALNLVKELVARHDDSGS
jgi:alanyl-tRNA synthetase